MASSSTRNLTKYVSGSTIVTHDVANSWFGGLYGTYEATLLDADDPRVIGHQHDGLPYDGHSSKINLVSHVTGKLLNQNLADEAVLVENVASFMDQGLGIPESKVVDGDTYYYLDLRDVYTYIDDSIAAGPFELADSNSDTVIDIIRQSDTDYSYSGLDFVFGSSKLDDLASGTNGDHRFGYDRSKGAFRAGNATGNQWDDSNRGTCSAAFGSDNTAFGLSSFVTGYNNICTGDYGVVGGTVNGIDASGDNSAVFGNNNQAGGVSSLISGSNAISYINGEVVHAGGKFNINGDAQTTEFTARIGIDVTTPSPGVTLASDGIISVYNFEPGAAYAISVTIIGKRAEPSASAGFYKIEAMGLGSTSTPTVAAISLPVITYISRSAYFTAGPPTVDVGMFVGATGELNINVWDNHIGGDFHATKWVATVSITKCKF